MTKGMILFHLSRSFLEFFLFSLAVTHSQGQLRLETSPGTEGLAGNSWNGLRRLSSSSNSHVTLAPEPDRDTKI